MVETATAGFSSKTIMLLGVAPAFEALLQSELGHARIVATHTAEEFLARLKDVHPDLVVAPASDAKRFIRELDRRFPRSVRVFLMPADDSKSVQSLAEVASEGHLFHALNESAPAGELVAQIQQLIHARKSARALPKQLIDAVFETEGLQHRLPVADISNNGFGIIIGADQAIDKLIPGSNISHLQLEKNGQILLRADRAVVRHFHVEQRAIMPLFRFGISIFPAQQHSAAPPVRDPVRCLGLVRRVVARQSTVTMKHIEDSRHTNDFTPVSIESRGFRHVIVGQLSERSDLEEGDITEILFDVAGVSYSGFVSVIELSTRKIVLSAPRVLSVRHRRSLFRLRTADKLAFAVSFVSPLTGEKIVRPALDIQLNGVAFPFDAAREVLPSGLVIDNFSLIFPSGASVECKAQVRATQALTGTLAGMALPTRCGLSLFEVPQDGRHSILEAFISNRSSSVRDGGDTPFPQIWKVVRDAKGFYADYPREEGPHLAVLEKAQDLLKAAGDGVAKSLLFGEKGIYGGHASGLRYYSRTWVLHHLAVVPGFNRSDNISQTLSSLIIEFAETLDDVEFVRTLWNTKNRFPNRFITWIARTMRTEGLTHLRFMNHMRQQMEPRSVDAASLMETREATSADLRWIENYFLSRDEAIRLRSDDLSVAEAKMYRLSSRLAVNGIKRERTIFLVPGGRSPIAVALVEEATEGLHWGEFTNSFSLIVPNRADPLVEVACHTLIAQCVEFYRDRGRPSVVALVDDQDVGSLEKSGFKQMGRFGEFTFHRSLIRSWCQLSTAVNERLSGKAHQSTEN